MPATRRPLTIDVTTAGLGCTLSLMFRYILLRWLVDKPALLVTRVTVIGWLILAALLFVLLNVYLYRPPAP